MSKIQIATVEEVLSTMNSPQSIAEYQRLQVELSRAYAGPTLAVEERPQVAYGGYKYKTLLEATEALAAQQKAAGRKFREAHPLYYKEQWQKRKKAKEQIVNIKIDQNAAALDSVLRCIEQIYGLHAMPVLLRHHDANRAILHEALLKLEKLNLPV